MQINSTMNDLKCKQILMDNFDNILVQYSCLLFFPPQSKIYMLHCTLPQSNSHDKALTPAMGRYLEIESLAVQPLSHVTPWTVVYEISLSTGFSRQEYWSGLPFPSPRDLLNPGIKPGSPAMQAYSLPTELQGKLIESLGSNLV